MSNPTLKIAIAEPSPIVRSGLELQLKRLARHKVQITQLTGDTRRDWEEMVALSSAHIYILNPLLAGLKPRELAPHIEGAKFVALCYGSMPTDMLKGYDARLYITDSVREISEVFDRLTLTDKEQGETQETQALTPREREIVVCVVKGMTNKEIAKQLFLSTHTVITHRRNISKKLQIHSPSGLTIYAIMHKMVELEDVNHKN